jgi:carboxyl-terminal processing protease
VPDILLGNVQLTKGEESTTRLKEADLAGHLANPEDNGDDKGGKKKGADKKKPAEEADYALSEALNLLKGLAILRPNSA